MGIGTSVRRAVRRQQEKLGPAIGRLQRTQYIESEGGYLREAIRQAPTGKGAASHQAPKDEKGNLRGASHLAPTGEGAASRQAPTGHYSGAAVRGVGVTRGK